MRTVQNAIYALYFLLATLVLEPLKVSAVEASFKLPESLLELPSSKQNYALILEKQDHKLSIYKNSGDNLFEVVKTYLAITGKKEGDKKYTGDKRTPEGIYFITKKIDKGYLSNKYGPGAFVLDYPNIFDMALKKTGYGIWIHGVDNDKRIASLMDTQGCVALQNQDWMDLEKYISIESTPIIITEKMSFYSSKQDLELRRKKILNFISSWKEAWEKSDLDQYIGFYADNFKSSRLDKKNWYEMKKKIADTRDNQIQIELSDIGIFSFKDQIIASFSQRYSSPDKKDFGKKFLYLQNQGDDYKILSEKFYPL